ncbi:adenosylcobinamide-GDP ribazoletransferase [Halobacillus litoralis]|uniref:adenosylcobinamide-GDP ribazoletransferase n=1 Tax=Halobacillus litoralis TaxID=45668 RepID=UPI001CD7C49B|nr:adenosylcobinamide-GDP ribazoletransferase [Halobacillus litoralis]MCA1022814.1 adenosylcobinamide-GDP ribazoletransferase [Halobacillus litoralis]
MKAWIQGVLLAFQFFSVLPVRRTLPMENTQLKGAMVSLPWVGLTAGGGALSAALLLDVYTPMSDGGIALTAMIISSVLTGGIHLDGWMDTGDAYFSYQSIEKRLEIMSDPRTGAFGVLSVLLLLAVRFLFLQETLHISFAAFASGLLVIPWFSRNILLYHFAWTPPAKQEGLCVWFQSAYEKKLLIISFLQNFILITFFIVGYHSLWIPVILAFLSSLLLYGWMRRLSIQSFGGITGDVLGAAVEGGETLLWIVWWISILFVMA